MSRTITIGPPVANLDASTAFYPAFGFEPSPDFSGYGEDFRDPDGSWEGAMWVEVDVEPDTFGYPPAPDDSCESGPLPPRVIIRASST
jgi:hypothetical protein